MAKPALTQRLDYGIPGFGTRFASSRLQQQSILFFSTGNSKPKKCQVFFPARFFLEDRRIFRDLMVPDNINRGIPLTTAWGNSDCDDLHKLHIMEVCCDAEYTHAHAHHCSRKTARIKKIVHCWIFKSHSLERITILLAKPFFSLPLSAMVLGFLMRSTVAGALWWTMWTAPWMQHVQTRVVAATNNLRKRISSPCTSTSSHRLSVSGGSHLIRDES